MTKIVRWLLLFILFGCTKSENQTHSFTSERSLFLKKAIKSKIQWHQWTDRTIAKAKKGDKLIFLNLGYGICESCVNFDKKTLETSEVSEFLNQNFISIKVDRFENPEITNHFLKVQTLLLGYGGWPLNMILTADFKPVFVIANIDSGGFLKILKKVQSSWQSDRQNMMNEIGQFVDKTAEQADHLDYFERNEELIKDFYARYTHIFDPQYGGKRQANKFPVFGDMRTLLHYYHQTGEIQALKMVEKTLSTIARGGIMDHLGGGVFRFSGSRNWHTPHFEKSLVDQASLLHSFIDLYLIKKTDLYRRTIEKTVRYLINQMSSSLGGFYSAQANQTDFYLWDPQEIQTHLSQKEHGLFQEIYSVNYRYPRQASKRVITRKTTFIKNETDAIEKKLLGIKRKNSPPQFEPIVVTSISAYTYSALARFLRIWPDTAMLKLLTQHFDLFLQQHLNLKSKIFHRSIGGEVSKLGNLDDYAFLIDALLEFYQANFESKYLKLAHKLQTQQNQMFFDSKRNLFRFSNSPPPFNDQFILQDQNLPSGQSMSYWNLLRLSRYFLNRDWRQLARRIIDSYPDTLKTNPLPYSHLLVVQNFSLSGSQVLTFSGTQEDCLEKSKLFNQQFYPNIVLDCTNKNFTPMANSFQDKSQFDYRLCNESQCQSGNDLKNLILKNRQN